MAKTPREKQPSKDASVPTVALDGDRIDAAVAAVLARDSVARTAHVNMMRAMTAMGAVILLTSTFLAWFSIQPITVAFVSSQSDGTNTRLQALGSPINTNLEIRNWVTNAVVQAYTMSFAHPEESLAVARPSFTPSGWAGFMKALDDSGNLKSIVENKYFTTAIPSDAPVLLPSASVNGIQTFKFQLPILVTYQSASAKVSQKYLVTVEVTKQPAWENVRELGISSILTQ